MGRNLPPLFTGYEMSLLVRRNTEWSKALQELRDGDFGRNGEAESKVSVAPSTADTVQCHQSADSHRLAPLRGGEILKTEYWSLLLAG